MTVPTQVPQKAQDARRLRYRKDLAVLDFRRTLAELAEEYTQSQVAEWVGLTQPTVSSVVKTARKTPAVLPGFSGATPQEICERYAAGLIERDQLVRELSAFPYEARGHTDGYDSLIVDPPGTWAEVEAALHAGLIGEDVYAEVFEHLTN